MPMDSGTVHVVALAVADVDDLVGKHVQAQDRLAKDLGRRL